MPSKKVASAFVDLELRTAAFKAAIGEAENSMKRFGAATREETERSREAVRLLNEDIGLHLPRGLQNLISKLPAVTAAMNLAFDAVIIFALIHSVVEVTEKITEFAKKNEEAAKKNKKDWEDVTKPITEMANALHTSNDQLDVTIAKLEHEPGNLLKVALDQSAEAAHKLYVQLKSD